MLPATDWQPSSSLETLRKRAQWFHAIRQFFTARGYWEVETPVLARYGVTDIYLSNIQAQWRNQTYYLQTSPEYHMKRLLAAGSGPIFQLARVFRDDELGRWHNPEFTLLEWYQLGVDHHGLMEEMDTFLQTVFQCPPLVKKTYQTVFQEIADLDPLTATLPALRQRLKYFALDNVLLETEVDRDQYLFLLMSHVIEPALARLPQPTAVYHFPPSQAALSQVHAGVAERFELYYRGVELANGFHELIDAELQRKRFDEDVAARKKHGLPRMEPDPYLLAALQHGLPPCSGVALGLDRLMTVILDQQQIAKTMAFDFSRV